MNDNARSQTISTITFHNELSLAAPCVSVGSSQEYCVPDNITSPLQDIE